MDFSGLDALFDWAVVPLLLIVVFVLLGLPSAIAGGVCLRQFGASDVSDPCKSLGRDGSLALLTFGCTCVGFLVLAVCFFGCAKFCRRR